jgi:K+-sensing histidine kinase KdpD
MLKANGDWVALGSADEQKPAADGIVEAWARSPQNPRDLTARQQAPADQTRRSGVWSRAAAQHASFSPRSSREHVPDIKMTSPGNARWAAARSHAVRYLGAVALTVIGYFVAELFEKVGGVPDAMIFAATIAITARFFGIGPSLFASALSIVAIDYTILAPLHKLEFNHPEESADLFVFVVLSLVISGTTHSLRVARASAEQLASRATRLLDVTTRLAEAELPADVARVMIGPGLEVAEAVTGMIGIVSGNELRVIERRTTRRASTLTPTLALDADTPLAKAMRSREPVWIESREKFREQFPAAHERLLAENDASAFLAMPLMHGDELVGGLVLGFRAASAFGATDQAFARLIAQSAGSALARACTLERERDGRLEAETMARARQDVLGVVAHDLRNPLGVVSSTVQMLAELDLPESERNKLLGAGKRAVVQMNRLIGDLLDVMRIDAGRLLLEIEDLPVATVLSHAEENVRYLADERNIGLTVEQKDPDLHAYIDRTRLVQVLGNLLGNAIKFTPPGGNVALRAWRDGADAVFEVSDDGPGISEADQAHLFDKYWQARSTDRRGVGLGLAISKGIVEAHGGRLWVESELGIGSRFYFAIPAIPVITHGFTAPREAAISKRA